MVTITDPAAPKLSRSARQILDLARDARDIALVGRVLKDFGPSCDDLPAKLSTLASRLDRYFGQTDTTPAIG